MLIDFILRIYVTYICSSIIIIRHLYTHVCMCIIMLLLPMYVRTYMYIFLSPVNCPALTEPTGGSISYTMDPPLANGGFSISTIATFSCTTEQLFNGDAMRTCLSTGMWSGDQPECLG